jgi:hypothetical protein
MVLADVLTLHRILSQFEPDNLTNKGLIRVRCSVQIDDLVGPEANYADCHIIKFVFKIKM